MLVSVPIDLDFRGIELTLNQCRIHQVQRWGIEMINREQLMGNWNSVVGSIKNKFGDFTKEELAKVEGNFQQLVGLIQRKTGKSQEQISSFISECCESAGTTYGQVANRAAHYADAAGEIIRDNYDRVATEAKKGMDYTAQNIGRRPLESLALAVGAGILAGLLLGISMTSRKR
ncbi:MAG TPA: CsbD family protein [Pirellula sp.]|nr:CsbD family protein [Pirellula sp.]